ncbi:MAG: Ig-like domain-containing protein, partial [Tannerella sp.]|nr:Ig-like domain-containing protein [Tannerella sp.]
MEKVRFLVIALIISATGFMTSCKSDDPAVEQVKIITLNKTVVSLLAGAQETLIVSFSPNNEGADKAVTWTSSNAGVATVSNGTITAVAQGEATITVALTSNAAIKAEAKVTVTTPVASISLDKTELLIVVGGEEKLTATVLPANADQSVTWSSSDQAIAVVTSDGTVQTKAIGTATITAAATSDPTKTATATVTVET